MPFTPEEHTVLLEAVAQYLQTTIRREKTIKNPEIRACYTRQGNTLKQIEMKLLTRDK